MTFIHIAILAYFLTVTLNWRRKEKYLLNNLYEKLKKKGFFKINVNSKESASSKGKGQIYSSKFLNSTQL